MSDPSDKQLMRAIQRRTEAALEQLYDRYAPTVLALCLRIVRGNSEAEDVLEQVFWEIWSKADRYDETRGAPLSYLLLLARSRALDRVRAQQRRESRTTAMGSLDDLEHITAASSADDSPLDHALVDEQRARVRAALAELDPRQRQVVELNFFDGFTHAEIADQLELPLGTVKTRIRRGLGVLRKHLRTHPQPDELA
jgi:RNA polymerase sigma-70 factor (ECF subfamily)